MENVWLLSVELISAGPEMRACVTAQEEFAPEPRGAPTGFDPGRDKSNTSSGDDELPGE